VLEGQIELLESLLRNAECLGPVTGIGQMRGEKLEV
jgi:hypothetical protein